MRKFLIPLILIIFFSPMHVSAFEFGAWIPYWTQEKGIPATETHLKHLTSIGPFAYEVQADGTLADKSGLTSNTAWDSVFKKALNTSTKIIPTILWNRTAEIRNILSDNTKRAGHVDAIVSVANDIRFAGIDIDYENKRPEDKEIFSKFLTELSFRLHVNKKILSCTVEPRLFDFPPVKYKEKQLMPWANDFSVLNSVCDEIRLMSYDQYFLENGTNVWNSSTLKFPMLSSDNWVESTIQYALKYISPQKLVLGVPTYGYDFLYTKVGMGYQFYQVRALSFASASALRAQYRLNKYYIHDELHFFFTYNKKKRYVTYSDASMVAKRIKLAKSYGLRGLYLFKIDGKEDPDIWNLQY